MIVATIIISSYTLLHLPTEDVSNQDRRRVGLIDGLSTTHENKTFWWTVQNILGESDYLTCYIQGGGASDTVDFYRNLPIKGFEILILRVHSAMNPKNGELAIFTNEKWSDKKASTAYLNDILNDRLARVRVDENSTSYFGITSKFVEAMNGRFENTVVIMMGCDGLKNQIMAKAFIQEGAKAYIGWDGPVTSQYVDIATIKLVEYLVLEKQIIHQAISKTNNKVGKDPYYHSTLDSYSS